MSFADHLITGLCALFLFFVALTFAVQLNDRSALARRDAGTQAALLMGVILCSIFAALVGVVALS